MQGQEKETRQALDARLYTPADLPLVQSWWRHHNGNHFDAEFIPPTAYIVTMGGIPSGFFSMHAMQCAVCYFGYPLVNPDLPKERRSEVVDYMIKCSKIWASKTGHKYVYISIRGEKMLSRLEQNGFISGEEGCQHMFCKVES